MGDTGHHSTAESTAAPDLLEQTPVCTIQPVEAGWLLVVDHCNGIREQHLCANQDEANAKALRALTRIESVRNY